MIFFIQETEVCNFADDTTIYSCSLNYEEVAHKLSHDTYIVLNWFKVNSMAANSGKFQIMFLGSKIDNSKITFAIENKQIKCKKEVKLLGITIDEKLTFCEAHCQYMQPGKQQIKSFDKNKEISIDGTSKIFI